MTIYAGIYTNVVVKTGEARSAVYLTCLTRPNEAGEERACHVQMADCTWHYAKTQNDRLRRLTERVRFRSAGLTAGIDQ